MSLDFTERIERLKNITGHLKVVHDFPLLVGIEADKDLFEMVKFCMKVYLWASLNAAGFKTKFCIDHLSEWREELTNLPNLTPNGLVVPKRETLVEFNQLHKYTGLLFESLGIDKFIDQIRLPAMARFVEGKPDPVKDSRPYASTKFHLDIWNGDPVNEILVLIPVLGDSDRAGIESLQPSEDALGEWIKTLLDYSQGAGLVSSCQRYDFTWKMGCIYFIDQFVLHRTVKERGGVRASLDFHFLPSEKVSSDYLREDSFPETQERSRNFVSLSEWYSLGRDSLFVPNDTFKDTIKRFSSGSAVNFSHNDPSTFKILKL